MFSHLHLPRHQIGDSFRLTFDRPGTYAFFCKLHTLVRGTVVVSSTPGDPSAEPDPIPRSRVDLRPPTMSEVRLGQRALRRRGTGLHLALDERAVIDAEYYRFLDTGRRRYAGYAQWRGFVGYNDVRFGARRRHFKARPGRYLAVLTVIDRAHNRSRPRHLRFRILDR